MDEPVVDKARLSPTTKRLIRSYGLLVLIAVAFLLLALFVHEAPKTVPTQGLPLSPVSLAQTIKGL